MSNAYHHDGIGSCLTPNPGFACVQKIGEFQSHIQSLNFVANWFTLVPGVIGVLLAAPFILDLEQGTYRLAWTQSITRRRWLMVKLALAIAAAVAAGVALTALLTWWRTPLSDLTGRLGTGTYDTSGTVAIGYALFALGLAVALGAVWRRSALSLTVAFVGYFAARTVDDYWLRNNLASPLHATWHGTQTSPTSSRTRTSSASRSSSTATSSRAAAVPPACWGHHSSSRRPDRPACGVPRDLPAGKLLLGTADPRDRLFTAIGAVLIIFAAWWTHERAA